MSEDKKPNHHATAWVVALIALTVLYVLGTGTVRAADPSPEIQRVLKERLVGKHDLKLDGLTGTAPTPEQRKKLEDKAAFEVYQIPYPKNTADYFSYAIYRFKDTGKIWIIRSGGFAGRTELFIVPKPAGAEKDAARKP